ncbi:MAG: methylated-DNA--[protein]-cysteine S-methyltransferase [Firmicutes bacterium]|uniref:Methylated-DNA--protein-cysteine methyltransferase n=1 Tax=Melghirimyces thermohalophilus TaxID=1236220 RepID=A0A1G6RB37_9BACL|nr:methylated-DNA--[protein]-cysteine S-methyltransferase [Melghirimyces thermohalophilus]MDA8351682.1 methylated-DNA--[protein]-cysteine S-methyltransferase [Bacillota bacterium]SDD01653.1 methylated-DNA-[protein]-cysteine S-methyltransferase [Melghirimyces thermohalophilus]
MVSSARVLVWSETDTPVGPITLAMTGKGLCRLDYMDGEHAALFLERWAKERLGSVRLERNDLELRPAVQQLKEYFDHTRKQFDLPVDLYGTAFQRLVWQQLQMIPYGEVRSYKDVAQAMGAPKAVRAVGGANNRNPLSIIIPCHRVVGSNGSLVGYGGGLKIKEYLLGLEGSLPRQARA